ncbi:MAG: hypothetical protein ABIQ82_03610 [Variovorax sp.]
MTWRSRLASNTVKRAYAAGAGAATQAKAGYDEARGKPTMAPASSTALQSGARAAGSTTGAAVTRLVEAAGTKRVYETTDGSTETRTGGTVSWRNNNPGNLKFEHMRSVPCAPVY